MTLNANTAAEIAEILDLQTARELAAKLENLLRRARAPLLAAKAGSLGRAIDVRIGR